MERFLLFVALGVSAVLGQQPPAAGALTGKVVDPATKEGIRKATVFATSDRSTGGQGAVARFSPPTIYSASTDDSGTYRFNGLAPGAYYLRAEKSGFLPKATERQPLATVVAGQEGTGPELLLFKQSVISGRVTDADGEPVEHVSVQAIPARAGRAGNRQPLSQAMTDDRGEFRLPRLRPGAYKLLATSVSNTFVAPNAPVTGEQHRIPAPTYFPSALDATAASEVTVGTAEERSGVEIRLQQTVAVRVAGRINVEGGSEAPVSIMLHPASLQSAGNAFGGRSSMAGADGRFSVPNVTPGDYYVWANLHRVGGSLNGMARVRVGQEDVDGVVISLQPLARLTGRVVAEGGGKLPSAQINISLRPAEVGMPGGAGGPVKPDGTFVIENVQRSRLMLNPIAPRGWFLKSVSVGGQRQPGLELDLTSGEGPLELVYSNKPGTVSGTVEGTVAGPAVAVALPDGGASGPVLTNLYKTAPVAPAQNTFKIEDIPPGNYLIVACAPSLIESLGDPSVWEKVKAKAIAVKVEEGGTVVATPRLIVESDLDEK